MSQSLLNRPGFLLDKGKIGDQIGAKSQRENGNQFRKILVGESPYPHMGDCE